METLETRVLLNADVDLETPQPSKPLYVLASTEAFAGAEAHDEWMREALSESSAVPSNIEPALVPYTISGASESFHGPVLPEVTGKTGKEHNLPARASIFLQDDQGNIRSSDDEATNATFVGGYGESQPAEVLGAPALAVSVSTGPPSPEELRTLPKVPWTPNYSHTGTIGADQDSVAYRVPVGPWTQSLTVDVQAREDGQIAPPRVDQVYLMGAHGELLAAVTSARYMTNGSEQLLVITLHDAPVGGELFLRLVRGSESWAPQGDGGFSSDDSPDGALGSPGSDSSGYLISILRTDLNANSQAPVTTAPGDPRYITTLPASSNGSAASTVAPVFSPRTETSLSDEIEPARVGEGGPDGNGAELTNLDEPAQAVYFGPLVSRTAAPLGPVLATFTGDPAPPTTRVDRPSRDVLHALGAELDLDLDLLLNLRSRRADAQAAGRRSGGSALADLRGGGGVPILVAGNHPTDAIAEADALAASLRRHDGEQEELLVDALDALPHGQEDEAEAEVVRVDLATRAAGFVIGLGLASGPLYPDLAALARRRLFRKSRTLRRKTAKRGV